jgi:hypothetical protein
VLIVNPADTVKGIYWNFKHRADGEAWRTDDAVVPLYTDMDAVSPAADVINGAMPIIVALVAKCTLLDYEPMPLLTPEQEEARLNGTLGFIRSQLQTALS